MGPAIGMVCQYGLMPMFAYLLGWLLLTTNYERLGLLLLGSAPGGAHSNFWVSCGSPFVTAPSLIVINELECHENLKTGRPGASLERCMPLIVRRMFCANDTGHKYYCTYKFHVESKILHIF